MGASGDGTRVGAGETLRERAGDGACDVAREGRRDPCGDTLRDSISTSRDSSSHTVMFCAISAEPSHSIGMSMTCCSSICTMAPLFGSDEGEGWLLGLR